MHFDLVRPLTGLARSITGALLACALTVAAQAQQGTGAEPGGVWVRAWEPATLSFRTNASPDTAAGGRFDEAGQDVPVPGGLLLANPWLHWRLTVTLEQPSSGRTIVLPGFFAGDGKGGGAGAVWQARFNPPNLPGFWRYHAVLERGHLINVGGQATFGETAWTGTGAILIRRPRANPEGFFGRGRLGGVTGRHYLRFDDGRYFLKGGVNSPENFLGYEGFTGFDDPSTDGTGGAPGTQGFRHRYEPHDADWRIGDPDWVANGRDNQGRAIIGALNALADMGANSLYCLPMNLGGDGRDTHPFLTNSDDGVTGEAPVDPDHALNWSVARMHEWNVVLEHAQRRGIMVQLLLAEREPGNVAWLGAADSVARRLFHKNLVTMFGHLGALKWNLCEENRAQNGSGNSPQFTIAELDTMARWIRTWDVHRHPLSVHIDPNDLTLYSQLRATIPAHDWWLDATSLQVHGGECNNIDGSGNCSQWANGSAASYGAQVEAARALFLGGGLGAALVIDLDEQGAPGGGAADVTPGHGALHWSWTDEDRRRRVLYDTYLSGGNLEWYFGYHDLRGAAGENGGGDLRTENFRTREPLLEATRRVRELIETLPFWEMAPADARLVATQGALASHPVYGAPEVLALPGEVALVYYPRLADGGGLLHAGELDLAPAPAGSRFSVTWFDARRVDPVGIQTSITLGASRRWPVTPTGFMPDPDQDLLLLVQRVN